MKPVLAGPQQRYAIDNPFPGLPTLERTLGRQISSRLSGNEALPRYPNALLEHYGQAFLERCRQYPDPAALALRQALARDQGLAPEQLLVDAGADSLIALMLRTYAGPGDTVLCMEGTYPTFDYFARAQGLVVNTLAYAGQGRSLAIDLQALANAAGRLRPKVVYLANPDNPTGRFHPLERVRAFSLALPEGTLLILDEAYIGFAEHTPDLGPWPNTVRLRSFSKAYGLAGLRVGYAVAAPELLAPALRARIHYAVSGVALHFAEHMLGEHEHLAALRRETCQLRQHFADFAAHHGLPCLPSATNFVAVPLARTEAVVQWHAHWLQRGVSVALPAPLGASQLLRLTLHPDVFQPAFLDSLVHLAREAT
ncbi:aminotransferase class I/II-fold pyridoxal phosphate-dependent enzyme [Pseudomonas typographi]|uniref:aminotransferase class I/II-fold pyridoxal phosphate-dependent enzyme n=1 Tax=Pseudomonas typographi TaxID=2715964 RepID=UPI001689C517|nr:aminotransferase class I/II-fold pyridoxal phosphate-dependent enzyme [Pseudomonas typographi]